MDQLLLLASLAEAWGPRGEALGARVPQERLSALLLIVQRERLLRSDCQIANDDTLTHRSL